MKFCEPFTWGFTFTFPFTNGLAQVENGRMTTSQQPETPRPDTEAKPVPPSERHDPTMLTPEEFESLRQEAKRSSEWARATLAARRAKS